MSNALAVRRPPRVPVPLQFKIDEICDILIVVILSKMLPKSFTRAIRANYQIFDVAMNNRRSIRIHGLPTDDFYGLRFHLFQFNGNSSQLSLNVAMKSYRMSLEYFITNSYIAMDIAFFYFPRIEITGELYRNELGESSSIPFRNLLNFVARKKFLCTEFRHSVPVWKELDLSNRCLAIFKPRRYCFDFEQEGSALSLRNLRRLQNLTVEPHFSQEGTDQFMWGLNTAVKYVKYIEIHYIRRFDLDLDIKEFQDFIPWSFLKEALKLILFNPTVLNEELHILLDIPVIDPISKLMSMVPVLAESEWLNFDQIETLHIIFFKMHDKKSVLVLLLRRPIVLDVLQKRHEQFHWKRITAYEAFEEFLYMYSDWHGESRVEELFNCREIIRENADVFDRIKSEYFNFAEDDD